MYFDLWLWTSSLKDYADLLIDNYIDPEKKYLKRRFYRESCINVSGSLYIKDIGIFSNMKPENLIIVENQLISFSSCMGNGYLCDSYIDAPDDQELLTITNFFLAVKDEPDLRAPLADMFHFTQCLEYINKK